MKIRSGFVSNSSSSSFVVLKDSLTEQQLDQILNYQQWVKFFITLDEEKWKDAGVDEDDDTADYCEEKYEKLRDRLINKFEYCDSDPWRIENREDYIFGETSMDNFDIGQYFDYIKINKDYLDWDDGWIEQPTQSQKDFIKRMKKKYRKDKINKIEGR